MNKQAGTFVLGGSLFPAGCVSPYSRMWPVGDTQMAAAVVQMSLGYRGLLAVRSRGTGPLCLGLVSPQQLRAFSVRKEPELEENPHYGKYRDKIQQLRRSNPASFDVRMEKRSEVKKQSLGCSKQAEFVRTVEEKAWAFLLLFFTSGHINGNCTLIYSTGIPRINVRNGSRACM
ncbi:hypothetical protein FKM82_002042 [Ascaphus truei]